MRIDPIDEAAIERCLATVNASLRHYRDTAFAVLVLCDGYDHEVAGKAIGALHAEHDRFLHVLYEVFIEIARCRTDRGEHRFGSETAPPAHWLRELDIEACGAPDFAAWNTCARDRENFTVSH